ncbi:unnamed protein product [Porites evermanni]|uniref:EGF-like domain-containing protein n=1 Tax=Porites evermanni TaxID=104178 RepID=A0ABN8M1R8_9CNID|nr:unnamed protein product [Porites evermanni]
MISAQTENSCEQSEVPATEDEIRVRKDFILHGHLLATHTSSNQPHCFLLCSNNCQCLSFNYNGGDGSIVGNCELKGAASYTNTHFFKHKEGWTYFEIVRNNLAKQRKLSCPRETCHNGCCRSNPCKNGATCREVCDVRVRRYNCACTPGYYGHRCHKPLRSCHDVLVSGRQVNGIY